MKLIADSKEKDLQLWSAVKQNDEDAFKMLYKKYWPPLVSFASFYLPDQSEREEVLQELFIELFLKRHKITINASVSSFLTTFTRNRILNYIRDRAVYKKHKTRAATLSRPFDNHTEEAVDFQYARKRIGYALENMPPRYRQVYILNKEYQFTVVKTAQLLKRPVATVEKQLKKALSFLREDLTDLAEMRFMPRRSRS